MDDLGVRVGVIYLKNRSDNLYIWILGVVIMWCDTGCYLRLWRCR
jgi:hypothetical protein